MYFQEKPLSMYFPVSSSCAASVVSESTQCKKWLQEPFYIIWRKRNTNKSALLMSYVLSKRNSMCLYVGLKVSNIRYSRPISQKTIGVVPHSALGYLCTAGANGFVSRFQQAGVQLAEHERAACCLRTAFAGALRQKIRLKGGGMGLKCK